MLKVEKQGKIELTDLEFDQLAKEESATRPDRLKRLKKTVERLFDGEKNKGLREKIVESFQVPQWGEYHNEGIFMDTHLDLIFENLSRLRKGQIPDGISSDVGELMMKTAHEQEEVLERYVFLHDISKMDTLLIKRKGEGGKSVQQKIGWEEWKVMVPADVQADPVALRSWFQASGIEGISYYHPGEKSGESKTHGKEGADEIRVFELEIDPAVLVAIENHEVAFQFTKPKAETYRKYFGSMNEQERALALTASFIDTMSSLGKNGEPDLSNFAALADSKRNDEMLMDVESRLASVEGLDPKKLGKFITDLRRLDARFPEKDSDQLFEKVKKEGRVTEYDLSILRDALEDVMKSGQVDHHDKERILELVRSGQADQLGRQFGPKMRFINTALKAAEKK